MSLVDKTLKYVRDREGWVSGAEVERAGMSWVREKGKNAGKYYKMSNISRRLRELVTGVDSKGVPLKLGQQLERKEENGLVWYRAKSPQSIIKYYVPATGQTIIKKIY